MSLYKKHKRVQFTKPLKNKLSKQLATTVKAGKLDNKTFCFETVGVRYANAVLTL